MSRSEFESVSSQSSGSFNLCSIESVASSNLPSTGSLYFSPTRVSYLSRHCRFFQSSPFLQGLGLGGQMTDKVKERLNELNIECVYVPANMTHFFQPLDLTVNGCAKQRMRKEFVTYYSSAVKQQLDSGKQLENIEVDFRLSVLKPLHAKWLVELFNFFTSTRSKEVIARG